MLAMRDSLKREICRFYYRVGRFNVTYLWDYTLPFMGVGFVYNNAYACILIHMSSLVYYNPNFENQGRIHC